MNRVIIVSSEDEDWQAVYVNGELCTENSSLRIREWMDVLQMLDIDVTHHTKNDDWEWGQRVFRP